MNGRGWWWCPHCGSTSISIPSGWHLGTCYACGSIFNVTWPTWKEDDMEREHGQWGKDLNGEWYLHGKFSRDLAFDWWLHQLCEQIEFV